MQMTSWLLGLGVVWAATAQLHVDWCAYFRQRNIYRPECKFYDQPPSRARQGAGESLAKVELPTCSPHYQYCTYNQQCGDNHFRCMDMVMFRECCARVDRQCPSAEWLNFRCVVEKAKDWCKKDTDCELTPSKMCCPTGCGFKICL